MSAGVVATSSFAVTSRDTLFEGPYITDRWHPNYDVAPDGKKSFVMLQPVEENRQLGDGGELDPGAAATDGTQQVTGSASEQISNQQSAISNCLTPDT